MEGMALIIGEMRVSSKSEAGMRESVMVVKGEKAEI